MHTLILKKTAKGFSALRARDPALPQRLRPAFILFDGQKSIADVMALLPVSGGRLQVLEDIKLLTQHGLLELLRPHPSTPSWSTETSVRLSSPDDEPFLDSAYADSAYPAIHKPATRESHLPASHHTSAPLQVSDPESRYMQAYAVTSRLVSELGLKGFRLQLAVEKAQGYHGLVALLPRMHELIDAQKLRAVEQILLAPDEVSVHASNAPLPAIIS